MERMVIFRTFEERDIDFIYKCKNNEEIWTFTKYEFQNFSYEEAVAWVHGCMCDDPSYKFWAICKNDESRDIVGWCSLTNIDYQMKTAAVHGIVIANPEYRDGFTWIYTLLFILQYVFETLNFESLTGYWLLNHPVSRSLSCFLTQGSSRIDTINKNGCNYSVESVFFPKETYYLYKKAGDLDIDRLIKKIVKFTKSEFGNNVSCNISKNENR